MGKSGNNKGRFLREIVMIASFAMLVVMVSAGLYADPGPASLDHFGGELKFKLSSLLPESPMHH